MTPLDPTASALFRSVVVRGMWHGRARREASGLCVLSVHCVERYLVKDIAERRAAFAHGCRRLPYGLDDLLEDLVWWQL